MKKKGSGFLVWGGILLLLILYPYTLKPLGPGDPITVGDYVGPRLIVSAPMSMQIISITGAVISLLVCFWFYKLSHKMENRKRFGRIFGYLFFGLGSAFPYYSLSEVTRSLFLDSIGLNQPANMGLTTLVISFFAILLFLGLAYLLIFRTSRDRQILT